MTSENGKGMTKESAGLTREEDIAYARGMEEAAKLVEYRGQCAVQMINAEERLDEKKSYAWDALQHAITIRAKIKPSPEPSAAGQEMAGWRCYWCDTLFVDTLAAEKHFGPPHSGKPAPECYRLLQRELDDLKSRQSPEPSADRRGWKPRRFEDRIGVTAGVEEAGGHHGIRSEQSAEIAGGAAARENTMDVQVRSADSGERLPHPQEEMPDLARQVEPSAGSAELWGTGWIYGNNYKRRAIVIEAKGDDGEPWYRAEDGTPWSSFDVTYRPDAAPSASAGSAEKGTK